MRMFFSKLAVVLLVLFQFSSVGRAEEEYVVSRLRSALDILKVSSLKAPDLSDLNLNYAEAFGLNQEEPERAAATEVFRLLSLSSLIDQIIDHLTLNDDFPHDYLADYADSYYQNIFLPLDREEMVVIEPSWLDRLRGESSYAIGFAAGLGTTIRSRFHQLFFKERAYVGAYLRILAKNLMEVQHFNNPVIWEFAVWAGVQWPDLVFDSPTGEGVDDWGMSPLLFLYKDFRGEDIEFYQGRKTADPQLLFPREENWDYGEETTGALIAYYFNEKHPSSMKDIHLGPFCLALENFDSGKKHAMQFELPPFTAAAIHAGRDYPGAVEGEINPAPIFRGELYIHLARAGDNPYTGFTYYDPYSGDLPGRDIFEQDAVFPFFVPTFYPDGKCPQTLILSANFLSSTTLLKREEILKKVEPKMVERKDSKKEKKEAKAFYQKTKKFSLKTVQKSKIKMKRPVKQPASN